MALEQHLQMLRKRHTEIDQKITTESSRPSPDERLLGQLKKQKLFLKDDISRLSYAEGEAA
jgi:hypothetical protein